MRKWVFLVAAATIVGTGTQAEAQGLRSLEPTTKKPNEKAKPPVATNSSDIVVTATRRSQRLSNVPIAVSAYGATALRQSGATDIREMTQLASSLSVSSTESEASASARLRGIGTVGDNPGLESSVAVFIDGVYRNRIGEALNDLGEVERIEVLRGPQGTLSGRNSSAGAVSIYTKYPEFTFGGFGEASYGNYHSVRMSGALTGPLVKDVLAFRIDGVAAKRDGFYRDIVNHTDFNDRNRYFVRGQLFFKPSPDLSLRVIGDYTYRDEKCCSAVYMDTREKFDPTPGVPGDYAIAPSNRIVNVMKELGAVLPSAGDPYNRLIAQTPGRSYSNVTKDYGISSRIGWTIGQAQLISLSSYREYRAGGAADTDVGNLDLAYRPNDGNAYRQFHTFTQETRLNGTLFGNRLDWLVGGYFAHETLKFSDNLRFGADYGTYVSCRMVAGLQTAFESVYGSRGAWRNRNAPGCMTALGRDYMGHYLGADVLPGIDLMGTVHDVGSVHDLYVQTSDNFAFFTHNIVRLTDTLSLTGGLRYTNEHKRLDAMFDNNNYACLQQRAQLGPLLGSNVQARQAIASTLMALTCGGNSSPALNGVPIRDSHREGQFTGTAVLSWQPVRGVLLYGSYAHGYKAGGYNLARSGLSNNVFETADAAAAAGLAARNLRFDPETVQSFELGAKYSGRHFLANVTAFRSAFTDFQLNTFNGAFFTVQNIGSCSEPLNGGDSDASATTGACQGKGKVGAGVVTQGFEIEAGAYPTEQITLNLAYTYAHTQYRNDLVGTGAGDPLDPTLFLLPGNQMSNAPRHVITSSAAWTPAIGSHGLSALFYVDSRLTSDYNTGMDLVDEKRQDGYVLVNARIGIRGRDRRWAVEIWGQNVFDTDYQQIIFPAYFQGSNSLSQVQRFGVPVAHTLYTGYLAEPRTYGLTLRTRF